MVVGIRSELPQLDQTKRHALEKDGIIYDSTGNRVLAVLRGSEARVLVASDEDVAGLEGEERERVLENKGLVEPPAPVMKQAIVAIEDQRFYEHRGIDLRGIMRAVWQDLSNKKIVQGGSTITQQFVKNAYVTSKRSISRKLKEAMLAWQLEQDRSKDWILTQYLNTIYFGNGAYGVERASQVYFGHGASKLSLAEAALLAGIPADPSLFNPATNPEEMRIRRREVLQAMLDQKDITYNEFRLANRAPLPKPEDIGLPGTRGPAQYFVDYVKQQLLDACKQEGGSAKVFGGGLKVKTTIDLNLQDQARQAIAKVLKSPDAPAAALVALDPKDGRVLAMVGGENYRESQFNLAVQGERQPGSSFKPFVLATALEQGISPSTTLVSKPVTINLGDRNWYVSNYEGSNLGSIDLRNATIYSDNTVYAQLAHIVGPKNIADVSHRLGITSPLKAYFSIALGGEAVNPLEMARAYATFAHGGKRIDGKAFGNEPRAVKFVGVQTKTNGQIAMLDQNSPVDRQVLDPAKNALLTNILQTVIQSGTGRAAQLGGGWSAAGKTGTTENHGDAWFVGYTPDLVTAVWVGYPNELKPMLTEYHGDPVAGGTFPAQIWKTFMLKALKEQNDTPTPFPSATGLYASPSYVVYRNGQLERDNGICKGAFKVWTFSEGGPSKTANCRANEVSVPNLLGARRSEAVSRLEAQPLKPLVVYKEARPRQWPNTVVAQIPNPSHRLVANDTVTLVLAKPLHGIVPRVVGLPLTAALPKLAKLNLSPNVRPSDAASSRRVLRQFPAAGVAAAPGMKVRLVVRGG